MNSYQVTIPVTVTVEAETPEQAKYEGSQQLYGLVREAGSCGMMVITMDSTQATVEEE